MATSSVSSVNEELVLFYPIESCSMSSPNADGTADAKNGKSMAPQGSMTSAEYKNYMDAYNNSKK
jgi:hypothetical protein